ncbi:FkbM family methyltransferase [Pontibacter locisalis]|uniref:FkbM family methyltransferase n=1 Tax=Pontibacter locisalis TaxID=1719035 RepID=A0ABW5IRL3_9BACT
MRLNNNFIRKPLILSRYISRLGFSFTFSYLFQRFILKKEILSLNLQNLEHKVFLRNNHSDFQVFSQIFIDKEYQTDSSIEPNIIIDCGANIGLATLFFMRYFPYSHYIVIEPEMGNFNMLTQNLSKYPNVTLINKAVWNKKGHIVIKDNGWGNAGFTVQETRSSEVDSIETISINDIIKDYNLKQIDILKLDIEGSEEQIFLETYDQWQSKVDLIFVEIHENLKPGLINKIIKITSDNFYVSTSGEFHIFRRKEKC